MKICAVAEGAVVMVPEIPFLETLLVKDVQALELMDLLSPENRLEADDTKRNGQKRLFSTFLIYWNAHQTNWLSTASDRLRESLTPGHHWSNVRVGDTASNFFSLSEDLLLVSDSDFARLRRCRTTASLDNARVIPLKQHP